MTARSDHLIERAAAKLREANAAAVPAIDRPQPPGSPAPFQPFVILQSPPPPQVANPVLDPSVAKPDAQPLEPRQANRTLQATDPIPSLTSSATPEATARSPEVPPGIKLDVLERAGMVVARAARTRISEEYRIATGRILRTLHEASGPDGANNVLMVTSARPGEGKSFTALNLAGSIAQNGPDNVLLVDVDPKVKPLSDKLGLGDAGGFLDLVANVSRRPADLIRSTAIPNLTILPVGSRVSGSAQSTGDAISLRPIVPTILRLARHFPDHLIILDTPPCLSTSDPHAIAPHVGEIVMVVEAERTQRAELEAAIDLVRVCPSITMLLNKVRMTTSHTFGAYDYFGSYT